MVPYDTYVQSVTVTHDRVPCVILANSRQIGDIKAFCTDRANGSVLAFDKTYNLGHMYVSVTVYSNMALKRKASDTFPSFIGPNFIHRNSYFDIFAVFMANLSGALAGCNFRQLPLGSYAEAALRKSMAHFFPEAALIACTRHLKENLSRNAQQVNVYALLLRS